MENVLISWEAQIKLAEAEGHVKDARQYVDSEWHKDRLVIACQRCGENAATRSSESYYRYWCDDCSHDYHGA